MSPRGLRKEDEELELTTAPWTNEETQALHKFVKDLSKEKQEALHDMLNEYMWSRILRRKAGWIVGWALGVPAAILAVWEPLERLFKVLRGH